MSNVNLDEILDYYNGENIKGDNLYDIYFYLYHLKKSENKSGQYSTNFINKYKNKKNIRNIKKKFKKRIKNYNIWER